MFVFIKIMCLNQSSRYSWVEYIINPASTWASEGETYQLLHLLYCLRSCIDCSYYTESIRLSVIPFHFQSSLLATDEKYPHIVYVDQQATDSAYNKSPSIVGDQTTYLEGMLKFLFLQCCLTIGKVILFLVNLIAVLQYFIRMLCFLFYYCFSFLSWPRITLDTGKRAIFLTWCCLTENPKNLFLWKKYTFCGKRKLNNKAERGWSK